MSDEFPAHQRMWRNKKPFTAPGLLSGSGISGTLANARPAKKALQAKRYISDRPNGITAPDESQSRYERIESSIARKTHPVDQSMSKTGLQNPVLAGDIFQFFGDRGLRQNG